MKIQSAAPAAPAASLVAAKPATPQAAATAVQPKAPPVAKGHSFSHIA